MTVQVYRIYEQEKATLCNERLPLDNEASKRVNFLSGISCVDALAQYIV